MPTPPRRTRSSSSSDVGCVLTDQTLMPLYIDDWCIQILTYPNAAANPAPADVRQRLLALVGSDRTGDTLPATVSFLSGRRRYVGRCFVLRSSLITDAPAFAMVFEREHRAWEIALYDASRRYNLSRRETETVRYLVHGLTTKEIAVRMNVSPNTVKQFLRLIMSKTGTTTRSGVLGKITLT